MTIYNKNINISAFDISISDIFKVKEKIKHVKIFNPSYVYILLRPKEKRHGYVDLVSDDSNKKTYILSKLGNGILNNEIQRLEFLLQDAKGGNEYEV